MPSPRTRRILTTAAAAGVLVAASFTTAVPANAAAPANGDDPVGGILDAVGHAVHHVTSPKPKPKPAPRPAPRPAPKPRPQHSGGTGHAPSTGTTPRDHAGGSAASVGAGKHPVADVSKGHSQAGSGRSSADATLLALGGYTVIGSHADSGGTHHASGPVPQIPACDASGGALCLDLLYADSAASADGQDASTSTGVADVCLGGSDPTGRTCDGLHLGVAQNRTHTRAGGTSTSSSSVFDACARQDGRCVVAGDVLGSRSASGPDAAHRKPVLAQLLLGDYGVGGPDDRARVEVTKECATEVLCLVLNQVVAGPGTDSSSAADATGLDGNATAGVAGTETGSSATQATPPPTSPEPSGKQGGSAYGALGDVKVVGQPILGLSQNRSQGDLDRTTGDATLLSVLGQEIIGSHADSAGQNEAHGPVPDNPLCASSGGALCLDPLYADSSATQGADRSDASTRTGVLAACLGGHDETGASCDGAELGIAQGSSYLHNDGSTGITRAGSSTSLADLCLHGDTACTVSADALKSSSSADSQGHKDQSSSIADVGIDGQQVGAPGDPIDVSVPTDCVDPGVLCLFLNQVAADAQDGSTVAGATVVEVTGAGGTVDVTGSQTQVTANGGDPAVVEPPTVDPPVVHPPTGTGTPGNGTTGNGATSAGPAAAAAGAGLPNTGGVRAGLLGFGMLLIATGAGVLTWSRRRQYA